MDINQALKELGQVDFTTRTLAMVRPDSSLLSLVNMISDASWNCGYWTGISMRDAGKAAQILAAMWRRIVRFLQSCVYRVL